MNDLAPSRKFTADCGPGYIAISADIAKGDLSINELELDAVMATVIPLIPNLITTLYQLRPEEHEPATTHISAIAELKLAGEHVEVEVLFRINYWIDDELRRKIREEADSVASVLIERFFSAIVCVINEDND